MTREQYRAIVAKLGLTQAQIAELMSVHAITAARWATWDAGLNGPAAILWQLLADGAVTVKQVENANRKSSAPPAKRKRAKR